MNVWRSRWWWLLVIPLAAGLTRLRFDTEVLDLLPSSLEVAAGLKTYQRHFADARELVVAVESADAANTTASARALAGVLRGRPDLVADVIWQPAWLDQPADAAELLAYLWLNQPPEAFRELDDRLAAGRLHRTLSEARERLATSLSPAELMTAGRDPFGFTQLPESAAAAMPTMGSGDELFASADGRFRVVFVEARPALASYRECRDWLAEIRGVVEAARRNGTLSPDAQIHFTGRPAFVTEIAGGMERDMTGSTSGTLATIAILFWLTHRRLRPLFWLLLVLLGVQVATLALAGLFLGRINVVSLGFAAILLGLAEDFGIVIYQESRSHPELGEGELRRLVLPGILWSSVTTAGAFAVLNLSELPGLGLLGSLVALGIVVAAIAMVVFFLPRVLKLRAAESRVGTGAAAPERFLLFGSARQLPVPVAWGLTGLLLVSAAAILLVTGVRFDRSPNVLAPIRSEARETLDRVKSQLGRGREPVWVLVQGDDEAGTGSRLNAVDRALREQRARGAIEDFALPTLLWPDRAHQETNRVRVAGVVARADELRRAVIEAGFTTNALFTSDAVLASWRRALGSPGIFWPTNRASRWVLQKMVATTDHGPLALGFVHPSGALQPEADNAPGGWMAAVRAAGGTLSGWELLGSSVFDLAMRDLPRVLVPVVGLVIVSLWLAFRAWREVAISLATLAFSGVLLAASMIVLHWDWNLMNLMAIPLVLGMGVDFSIHMQLALQRHKGDIDSVRGSVGRALLLAGSTTVAGFASLAFSSNSGLASLGRVCGLGILLALMTAVYLLPAWWAAMARAPGAGAR